MRFCSFRKQVPERNIDGCPGVSSVSRWKRRAGLNITLHNDIAIAAYIDRDGSKRTLVCFEWHQGFIVDGRRQVEAT
jgi:hypothetical protein